MPAINPRVLHKSPQPLQVALQTLFSNCKLRNIFIIVASSQRVPSHKQAAVGSYKHSSGTQANFLLKAWMSVNSPFNWILLCKIPSVNFCSTCCHRRFSMPLRLPCTAACSFLCLPTVIFQQVTLVLQDPESSQLVVNCYSSVLQWNIAIQHAVDSVLVS